MNIFLWAVVTCVLACACADRGGSLRGALEALQRRQRGRQHGPAPPDYEALYEFVPPQGYPEPDYDVDIEDVDDEPTPKYIIKLLNENQRAPEAYEYKVIKKNSELNSFDSANKKSSAFRERSQHTDNDRLRDLFMDKNEAEEKDNVSQEKEENDAEYALLLGQLWSKYKNNKAHLNSMDNAPQGVVKLYKEKVVKKRYSDNWGPIAFKRKRSPDLESEKPVSEYDGNKRHGEELSQNNLNYNAYEVTDNDKDNIRGEEYAIAFQPLDDDSLSDLADEDQYSYDTIEKRFPVSKRSSGPYNFGVQKKRYALDQNKHDRAKAFRSSTGTDPKLIQDLSKIFGNSQLELIKNPVKRSSDNEKSIQDSIPPNLTVIIHNQTKTPYNETENEDNNHEHHELNIHPPGVTGDEVVHDHNHHDQENHDIDHIHDHKHNHNHHHHDQDHKQAEKPITLKKKSIDWSDYFGVDKKFKKQPLSFINNPNEELLKKQYFDTFNKEVIYPLSSFRKHDFVKRTFAQNVPTEELDFVKNNGKPVAIRNEKRSTQSENESKLDNIDKKLKNMEGLIVDEALHYTSIGEELDSKEEQEMKEKLLSRLAAAYSLEKMRKALKEFKQSLQIQKALPTSHSQSNPTDMKDKRVAVKKEKVLMSNNIPVYTNDEEKNNDFEDEQGAGHYLNGKGEEQLSEGYMGGSGRHRIPVISTGNCRCCSCCRYCCWCCWWRRWWWWWVKASSSGACPVLAKIVQRCRGVDLLTGDRGQLFLPLCSLHQICYLCGEAPPTTCDLVFLSEADSTCEGDMSCQRAARSALMALRELHDNLADELDGECEASPCLPATLKLNIGWQRALQR